MHEALGNNHRVYGVYSPEPLDEVFCVKPNFVGKLGHYVIDLRLPKRRLLSTGPIEDHLRSVKLSPENNVQVQVGAKVNKEECFS